MAKRKQKEGELRTPEYKGVKMHEIGPLKDGTMRWRARIYVGSQITGSTCPVKCVTTRSLKELKAKIDYWQALHSSGEAAPTDKRPLRKFIALWLDEKQRGEVDTGYAPSRRTMSDYRRMLNRWLLAPKLDELKPFAGVRMKNLRGDVLRQYFAALRDVGATADTRRRMQRLLKQILKTAVEREILKMNPMNNVVVRRDKKQQRKPASAERRAMTQDQVRQFLAAARNDRDSALWHVMLDGGLRPSECLGLQWDAVNWDEGAVEIKRTLSKLPGQAWCFEACKTPWSEDTVYLSKQAMDELRRWRKEQMRWKLAAGAEWNDHNLVFSTTVGTPLTDNGRRSFRRVSEAARLGHYGPKPKREHPYGPVKKRPFIPDFSPYCLRHTCATLLYAAGVPSVEIQKHLRHKPGSPVTHQFYFHSDPDAQRQSRETRRVVLFGTTD